jgi:hypothetical protein
MPGARNIAIIVLAALIFKTALLLLPYGGVGISPFEDSHIDSWERAGTAVLGEYALYGEKNAVVEMDFATQFSYNYLPLWAILSASLLWAAKVTPLGFPLLFQITLLIAEILTALLIYIMIRKKSEKLALIIALVYVFNPISLWDGLYFHQIDVLVVIFMTAAVYWFDKENPWKSALLLSIATMFKPFPAILVPLFLFRIKFRKWPAFAALYGLPMLMITIPFITTIDLFRGFLEKAVLYTPVHGAGWGFSKMIILPLEAGKAGMVGFLAPLVPFFEKTLSLLLTIWSALLALGLIAVYWLTRKRDLHEASVITLIAFMVISIFYFPHYLVWALPLFFALSLRWSLPYLALSSVLGVVLILSNAFDIPIGSADINLLSVLYLVFAVAVWLFGILFLASSFGLKLGRFSLKSKL